MKNTCEKHYPKLGTCGTFTKKRNQSKCLTYNIKLATFNINLVKCWIV